ncbi:tRNA (uracil-O(2)-)-methyltransferase [Cladobotryum mycophilum]|uniref:tRNA (uracil-O(2)-)-methyltransferase n=1 Tax=Cladobotryum mycophilum TaxID=491253 RepID=A0ABR0T3C6_9HYPO
MKFEPQQLHPGSPPFFQDVAGSTWEPLYSHPCTFDSAVFVDKMINLIKNPNLNSSWLFRADILYDGLPQTDPATNGTNHDSEARPITHNLHGMTCYRALVRRLIPRNDKRDQPLDQTCSFYKSDNAASEKQSTLIIYTPHTSSAADLPFYHPKVQGIAHLHEWDGSANRGTISIHFWAYPEHPLSDTRLQRTAYHLLEIINKHGHGTDYVKRVHHDVVVPQQTVQDRYALLKNKYARQLVDGWAENTDPTKHVFEDLGIAAFLIELWADMYKDSTAEFPGFVDIGCGNGLLVYILTQEGYSGWGFDARRRKSWAQYQGPSICPPSGSSLEERLLLPAVIPKGDRQFQPCDIHDGTFPQGTFIISNHADELTPWTPILATISQCPFIMIPCCSHNLTGDRFRAPPPRDKSKSKSAYASLVDWASQIAEDCGWEVETEMLRIPSTRNTCLLGRKRTKASGSVDVQAILDKYGGVEGYYEAVVRLVKSGPRGH